MPFRVVAFLDENENCDYVPSNWIIGRNKCYWPPVTNQEMVELRKTFMQPDPSTWSLLNIRLISDKDIGI